MPNIAINSQSSTQVGGNAQAGAKPVDTIDLTLDDEDPPARAASATSSSSGSRGFAVVISSTPASVRGSPSVDTPAGKGLPSTPAAVNDSQGAAPVVPVARAPVDPKPSKGTGTESSQPAVVGSPDVQLFGSPHLETTGSIPSGQNLQEEVEHNFGEAPMSIDSSQSLSPVIGAMNSQTQLPSTVLDVKEPQIALPKNLEPNAHHNKPTNQARRPPSPALDVMDTQSDSLQTLSPVLPAMVLHPQPRSTVLDVIESHIAISKNLGSNVHHKKPTNQNQRPPPTASNTIDAHSTLSSKTDVNMHHSNPTNQDRRPPSPDPDVMDAQFILSIKSEVNTDHNKDVNKDAPSRHSSPPYSPPPAFPDVMTERQNRPMAGTIGIPANGNLAVPSLVTTKTNGSRLSLPHHLPGNTSKHTAPPARPVGHSPGRGWRAAASMAIPKVHTERPRRAERPAEPAQASSNRGDEPPAKKARTRHEIVADKYGMQRPMQLQSPVQFGLEVSRSGVAPTLSSSTKEKAPVKDIQSGKKDSSLGIKRKSAASDTPPLKTGKGEHRSASKDSALSSLRKSAALGTPPSKTNHGEHRPVSKQSKAASSKSPQSTDVSRRPSTDVSKPFTPTTARKTAPTSRPPALMQGGDRIRTPILSSELESDRRKVKVEKAKESRPRPHGVALKQGSSRIREPVPNSESELDSPKNEVEKPKETRSRPHGPALKQGGNRIRSSVPDSEMETDQLETLMKKLKTQKERTKRHSLRAQGLEDALATKAKENEELQQRMEKEKKEMQVELQRLKRLLVKREEGLMDLDEPAATKPRAVLNKELFAGYDFSSRSPFPPSDNPPLSPEPAPGYQAREQSWKKERYNPLDMSRISKLHLYRERERAKDSGLMGFSAMIDTLESTDAVVGSDGANIRLSKKNEISFAEYVGIPTDAIPSVKDGSLGYKCGTLVSLPYLPFF
jgi:hypothetical protein